MPRAGVALALALLVSASFALPVRAADETTGPISVKVNMARILRIGSPAATVVIGNPGVADVTIQDPQTLILTGKSYGQTNMIVLDQKGNPIADTIVEVVQDQADTVTMFIDGARATLACAPKCSPSIMVGDSPAFTQQLTSSMNVVAGAAQ